MSDESPAAGAGPGLRGLASALPARSVAGRLRPHLPAIDQHVRNGVAHETIVAALAEDGLVVGLSNFRHALYAYRKRMQDPPPGAAPITAQVVAPPPSPLSAAISDAAPAGTRTQRLEQPVGPTPVAPRRTLEDALDPKKRAAFADQFETAPNMYLLNRAREKRAKEDRAKEDKA